MATLPQWEAYARELAPLSRFSLPDTAAGRDLAERIRRNDPAGSFELAMSSLKRAWTALPANMRTQAIAAITDATGQVMAQIEAASATIDLAPVIGDVVNAAIGVIVGFVEVAQTAKKENQKISNFAHQRAQVNTIRSLKDPWMWIYTPARCKVYAQYVKVRTGGDWDVKPAFTRAGLQRDAPFLGVASPPDQGNCKKQIRVGLDYPFDPPSDCVRTLGLSALFYPWWSGAYAPEPLPVWEPDSGDGNTLLISRQQHLIADPNTNLRVPLGRVMEIRDSLLQWWDATRPLVPINSKGLVVGSAGPRIDGKENPDHIPSAQSGARWYLTPEGMVTPYPNQPDSDTSSWGVPAAPGSPSNLGVTIAQRNAVVSMAAAFAARRLATLRDGKLAAALLQDYGKNPFDDDAMPALEYAAKTRETLPYPELGAKQATPNLPPTKVGVAQLPTQDDGGGAAALAIGAALLFL